MRHFSISSSMLIQYALYSLCNDSGSSWVVCTELQMVYYTYYMVYCKICGPSFVSDILRPRRQKSQCRLVMTKSGSKKISTGCQYWIFIYNSRCMKFSFNMWTELFRGCKIHLSLLCICNRLYIASLRKKKTSPWALGDLKNNSYEVNMRSWWGLWRLGSVSCIYGIAILSVGFVDDWTKFIHHVRFKATWNRLDDVGHVSICKNIS